MPFLSYQTGAADAMRNAGAFIKAGADAVKLEGGHEVLATVEMLLAHGIPVVGHVGLQPQRVHEYGGYRTQGRDAASAYAIFRAAKALDGLGVFACVLESVPAALARLATAACACPTIGIGAGPHCDGQVLVFNDLVGLTPAPPRFAKAFTNGREAFRKAVESYSEAVRTGGFPGAANWSDMEPAEIQELGRMIGLAQGK
jgi:3-methyl-2-oxobutanoate hydroxymethyltransferase